MATKKKYENSSVHFDVVNKLTEAMNRSVSWFNTANGKWTSLVPKCYTIYESITDEDPDSPAAMTAVWSVTIPIAQTYVFDYWGLPTASKRETARSASLTIRDVCIDSRRHYTARISKEVGTTASNKTYRFVATIEVEDD